jgi:hypothetical protein
MKFTLTIESRNAAYNDDESSAAWLVADQITEVAARLRDGSNEGSIKDPINGQKVGDWTFDD